MTTENLKLLFKTFLGALSSILALVVAILTVFVPKCKIGNTINEVIKFLNQYGN